MTETVTSRLLALLPSIANYAVYAAIAAVTLIGFFKCLLPLWSTTGAMRRAIRRLEAHAGETAPHPVWQETLFMGKRLKGCWLRFLQNAEQLDHRGLPCNVEDYINDDTVTHGPGNAQLAELIPTLLTSLGILGTFLGMTQGLSGLNTTTTEAMMSGIQQLLEGMGVAFGTSVAGVSCSLVFNMINRISQGSSYRAIDDFTESFTQLAMQRPLDNDVQLICQNQDRNSLLNQVTENVSGRMASSIELAVGRALHPVAASMDRFLLNATQAQLDGVQRISDAFIDRMNVSLNNEFLELGRTLSDVNQQERLSLERVNATLNAVTVITEDVGRIHAASNDIIRSFESYISELTETRNRDVGFEQNAVSLLTSMQAAAQDQGKLILALRREQEQLSAAVTQFGRDSAASITSMRSAATADTDALRSVSEDMSDAGEAIARSCTAFTKQVENISASMTRYDQNMEALTKALLSRMNSLEGDGADGDKAQQLSGIQQTLRAIQAAIEKGTPAEEG